MTFPVALAGRAVACARPLPAALIEARAAVFNPLLCQDLNQTARRVLFGILTFLNLAQVGRAVFPKRDLLRAESLLNSEPTLYRGLKLLEVKGYITRSQERRSYNGEFHLSPIKVTAKALSMLGLDGLIHKYRSIKVRDGRNKKHTKPEQSYQNTVQQAEASAKDAIDSHTGLPCELLRLLNLDVQKGAICWLMAQARSANQRLGDIVAAVWHRIRQMRGRQVISYLRFMIHLKLDYAFIAKERTEANSREDELSRAKAYIENLGESNRGYEVVNANNEVLGYFEPSTCGVHAVISARGAIPVNLSFARAALRGEYRLRPPSAIYGRETEYA